MQAVGKASQQPSPPQPHGGLAPGLQHTQAGSTSSLGRPAFPFSPLCLGKNFPSLHWLGWRIRGPGYLLSLLEARSTVLQAASLARSLGHCTPPPPRAQCPPSRHLITQAPRPFQALPATSLWHISHAECLTLSQQHT